MKPAANSGLDVGRWMLDVGCFFISIARYRSSGLVLFHFQKGFVDFFGGGSAGRASETAVLHHHDHCVTRFLFRREGKEPRGFSRLMPAFILDFGGAGLSADWK